MFDDGLRALRAANHELFEVVAADIQYLLTLKHGAELPQVRWGIAQSEFTEITGEVRSHIVGEPEFVRILFVMPADESICVFALIGDKNTDRGSQGSDWYDGAVPVVDEVWRRLLAESEDG
jgi:hypothetical protein